MRKLLGRKVSLRYALSDEGIGHSALGGAAPDYSSSELVGVVMSVNAEGHITVVDRRGNARDVAIDAIEALKVFPS